MAIIKKRTITSAGEDVEKGEPMHAVGHIMENLILLRFLKKLKIE
jgi:hypothetical protein